MNERQLRQAWQNRYRPKGVPKLGQILGDIARTWSVSDRWSTLQQYWNENVPAGAGGRLRLASLRGGVIYLEAGDPATRFEAARRIGPMFLESVRREFPEWKIREVRVQLAR